MLFGRCSWELFGRELQRNYKARQRVTNSGEAEASAVLSPRPHLFRDQRSLSQVKRNMPGSTQQNRKPIP
jgi:hypothetical protein